MEDEYSFWKIPKPIVELSLESGILSVIGEGDANRNFFLTVWPPNADLTLKLRQGDRFLNRLQFEMDAHSNKLKELKPFRVPWEQKERGDQKNKKWRGRDEQEEEEKKDWERIQRIERRIYEMFLLKKLMREAILLTLAVLDAQTVNQQCQVSVQGQHSDKTDDERKKICEEDKRCQYFVDPNVSLSQKTLDWILDKFGKKSKAKGKCFSIQALQAELEKAVKDNQHIVGVLKTKSELEHKRQVDKKILTPSEEKELKRATQISLPVFKLLETEEDKFRQISEITLALGQLEQQITACKEKPASCTANLDEIAVKVSELQKKRRSLFYQLVKASILSLAKILGIACVVVLLVIILLGVFHALFPGVTLASAASAAGSAISTGASAIGQGLLSAGSAIGSGAAALGSMGVKALGAGLSYGLSASQALAQFGSQAIKATPGLAYTLGKGIGETARVVGSSGMSLIQLALSYPYLMFTLCAFQNQASSITNWILKYIPASLAVVVGPILVRPASWLTPGLCTVYAGAKAVGF